MGVHRTSARRIAARGASVVVGFVVAACGGGGAGFVGGPPVPARVASDDPLDDTVLHYVDLTVAGADLPALVPFSDDYVPCDVRFDETDVARVGLRIKGQSTARPVDNKPSWTLKTNEFVSGQRLHGLRRIHLHNCVYDDSFLKEPLAYAIWRRAGHPVRRAAHARVTLNGRYLGVYVVAEAYDKTFLGANFADDGGNLYEGVPGVDVTDPANLELDTNEDLNDRSDLEALAAVLLGEPDATLPTALEDVLDVDRFLTYLAVEALVGHWDGYGAMNQGPTDVGGPHNWYAYGDPSDGRRFTFLAHSADLCFSNVAAPVLATPHPSAVLAVRLLAHPALRARYVERVEQVLDTAWDVDALLAWLDAAEARFLGSAYEGDGDGAYGPWSTAPAIDRLRRFVRDRPEIVRAEVR
jgi:spore coat protein CotH